MKFKVLVEVDLKAAIADPAGATIERALPALGFENISQVRVGKAIRFSLDAANSEEARQIVQLVCDRLLANPVIEDTSIVVEPVQASD